MGDLPSRHDDLKLHLRVLGEDHELSARARIGQAKLLEVLPLARQLADGITGIAIEKERAEGRPISCKKGCTWCCHQLVPLAPAEAVRLAEVVEAMPKERRRRVKERFEKAVRRMEEIGLLDRRAPRGRSALLSTKTDGTEAWNEISRRYFEAQIPCPFLEAEACSIYAERPMICREYHVTTPAELCGTFGADVEDVPRITRMSEVMVDFTNGALGREDASIPLTLALEWAGVHRGAFDAQGDGEEIAIELVRCVQAADGT